MAKKVTDGENGARGQGLQIVRLSVADLSGDPANARKHDERKRGKKTVVCQGCGESRVVRVDTSPKLCRSCNARKSSKPGETRPQRVLGQCVQCEHCGNSYYRNRSEANKKKFCSTKCAADAKRKYAIELRVCKHCGGGFKFSAKPASNNAGNFCSLKCRNASYVGTYRGKPSRNTKTHRPGWASISRRFRRLNDFCSGCGATEGRLVVHHVDPYWRSKNNDFSNLVTLCPKCHGRAELLSGKVSEMCAGKRDIAVALIQAELHDWWHVFQGRRLLAQ